MKRPHRLFAFTTRFFVPIGFVLFSWLLPNHILNSANNSIHMMATSLVSPPISKKASGKEDSPATYLSTLIKENGTFVSGDKTFCDFTYTRIGDMPPATNILVIPIDDGIRFQGAFYDAPGDGASDALIGFKVKAPDCAMITHAGMYANPLVIGDGFFIVTETFLPTEPQTTLAVYDIEPPGLTQLVDESPLENPQQILCVQKDIIANSSNDQSFAVMSFIDQKFKCIMNVGPGPGVCCGGRPNFQSEAYKAFGGGQIVANTQWRLDDFFNAPGNGVLNVYDLTDQGTAPIGSPWFPSVYTHEDWYRNRMGQVFGVAIDDLGNIYSAHTAIYSIDHLGSIGGAVPGQIYKIDANTGNATVFATLPNASDPVIAASSAGIRESYPGLGNICFDCEKQVLYATNFEDGRIYRIDSSGLLLSTWDHASQIVADGNPELGDAVGVAPLGERVWAVQSHQGRVYYSVWNEDQGIPSATESNEIWSIECDDDGEFIAGTEQLEVSMPNIASNYSPPVSDIAFSPSGAMMCAERTMRTEPTQRFVTGAHQSRALEFVWLCGWVLSNNDFEVGVFAGTNCAGGCDYNFLPNPDNRVWVSSDAIIFSNPIYLYGLQGLPETGGDPSNSVLLDSDSNVKVPDDKTRIGSLELSCPPLAGKRSQGSPRKNSFGEHSVLQKSGSFSK